ncbi:hypothetical protein ACFQI7_12985 [Paenibacillus allorhizosphaerae]|uniref:Prophage tail endopeptidase domain-containing protein n=1 Tax=Paenibacillus allorhizosphaerae TaxID=2849866 RepID=A0ABN7TRA5_9BACL|nr:hypothetical protein [Paenibacillus allorhizosphaerae]CAG7648173.1 hypothetical protein PAECIP111802_04143 [Paenibacillus allorhizosphaerae]
MSSLIVIQSKDSVFFAADSATSISLDGQLYRLNTQATKLHHFDNLIVFCSGDMNFCYSLMDKFGLTLNRNVNSLQQLLVESYNGEKVEILIAEYNDEQTIVHQLSPYNNFDPVIYTNIPFGGLNILTAGVKTEESYQIACEALFEGNTIPNIFIRAFDEISYEAVGGTLTVYKVNKSGVSKYLAHKINEKPDIKTMTASHLLEYFRKNIVEAALLVGERIYGKVIMGTNLAIEDEHGIVKWQGSKGEIFDRNEKLVMKMGLVSDDGAANECFGLVSFNDTTKVSLTDCKGIAIERKNLDTDTFPSGWEKVLWANTDGTLYTHDLVAENIKIVNSIGKTILDAENNYLDIGDFQTIVMDNKFTTLEKMQIITELYKIEAGYKRMIEQANQYMRSDRDAVFDTSAQFFTKVPSEIELYSTSPLTAAYNALLTYMEQFIKITNKGPLTIDINDPLTEMTSVIDDRAEFILKFQNYYDAEKDLRNKIEDAQFYSGLNMGQFYNNIVIGNHGFIALRNDGKYRAWMNATDGLALQKWENNHWTNKVYASIGNSTYEDGTLIAEDLVAKRLRIETKQGGVLLDANALNFDFTVLDSIILDDVILSTEKITLANQYKSITKQYTTLIEQIKNNASNVFYDRESSYYGLDYARNQLVAAGKELDDSYNTLTNYMTPVFADMNATTNIVKDLNSTRSIFHAKWEDFYKAYENARVKLAEFLEKSSLQLGRNYNNTVIDAENGIVVTRSNMLNRTKLNATEGISIERNVGSASNPSWEKKFYVGLDGKLFAEDLEAIRLKVISDNGDMLIDGSERKLYLNKFDIIGAGVIRSEHVITNTITAADGYIANLTVNHLKTLTKDADIGEYVDFIDIKDNESKWVTGKITSKTPATDSNGRLLYWKDASREYLTNDISPYVAYSYDMDYDEKLKIAFQGSGIASYPYSIWGSGDGSLINTPDYRDSARGYIYKTPTEFHFRYNASNSGDLREIRLHDSGLNISSLNERVRLYGKGIDIQSENGSIHLQHSSGSSISIDESGNTILLKHTSGSTFILDDSGLNAEIDGDISLNAKGNIQLKGSRIDLN